MCVTCPVCFESYDSEHDVIDLLCGCAACKPCLTQRMKSALDVAATVVLSVGTW